MVTIRFMQDRVVQDEHQGTPHETRFSAGQVVDLAEASAAHWLSRGAAGRVLPAEEPPASPAGESTPASRGSAETQPSLDLTGAPAGDASPSGDDGGSSGEAAVDASEASAEEAAPSASESQPGLDLAGARPPGESGAGDGGSPDNGQAGGSGEKSDKPERKPARASAKAGSKA